MKQPAQVTRLHDGPVFSVDRMIFDHTDGPVVKDVVRHPGAVTVVAREDDGRLVMIRNHRVAVGRPLLEFCAGKLEPGEAPALSAVRELEEETGRSAASITPLGRFYTSPGFADELMHVFLAEGLAPVARRLEAGEEIEVVVMDVEELREIVRRGELEDGKSLAAFHLFLEHLRSGDAP
ncbi:MAG: NUDIX hydrolase [Planctomycetota bacterium]|nr:NUDIX hydrolase [Planctomycetota bacterium]MEC8734083.1 NUDIX hydrolase [Planctomycetota bacterium]MEC9158494.1 NUDIX hydrolase [Planctomycetota bacterium]MEC9234374.1 NUDIX hydrolase [Planctomycetota bacterium]